MLDVQKQTAFRKKKDLTLTRKEFALLEYLMRNLGAVVAKTTLIEHAWYANTDVFSDAIETHMMNLRKKIGKPEIIHTVHGRGYRID